jgi:FkbM family methyltransferase
MCGRIYGVIQITKLIIMIVNHLLKKIHEMGFNRLLSMMIYVMYKVRSKNIKSVRFLKDLHVWEFKISNDYFYSSGPGWAYDYQYLLNQFSHHLGYYYLPKEGDVVVDVGAGVGEELMIFSKSVGEKGKVFAIEAHPKTFRALQYNLQKNNLKNVILLNVAISDVPGKLFIEDTADSLSNSVSKVVNENGFTIDAITIEQLVEQYDIDRINFIKVNIEGAEQLLIKGIGKAIDKIDKMAISAHDFRYKNEGNEFFKTKAIILDFLQSNNFDWNMRNTNNPLLDDYIYAHPKK